MSRQTTVYLRSHARALLEIMGTAFTWIESKKLGFKEAAVVALNFFHLLSETISKTILTCNLLFVSYNEFAGAETIRLESSLSGKQAIFLFTPPLTNPWEGWLLVAGWSEYLLAGKLLWLFDYQVEEIFATIHYTQYSYTKTKNGAYETIFLF